MKSILIFVLSLIALSATAQTERFVIDWDGVFKQSNSKKQLSSLHLTTSVNGEWNYTDQWEVRQSINKEATKFINVQYETVPNAWLSLINRESLPSDIDVKFNNARARNIQYATAIFSPFVLHNGQVMRVTGGEVQFFYTRSQNNQAAAQVITNSVLATGSFYKFYVEESGVHQLTRGFLQGLGMNTNDINPQSIKVYGLGGSPLPFRNSDNTNFDLREIPIQVLGGQDGSFDGNDRVLFYGESTSKFHPELNTHVNPYSDRSYYYITAGGANGARIQSYTEPLNTQGVTFLSYDDYQFVERDLTSVVKVGRRWFGEAFNFENVQSFEFEIENPVPGQLASLKVEVAGVSESETSFDVAVNGASVGNITVNPISDITLARGATLEVAVPVINGVNEITLTYNNAGNPSSTGYLDFISLEIPTQLSGTGAQFIFRNADVATQDGVGAFTFSNAQGYSQIWEVTDQTSVRSLALDNEGSRTFKFNLGTDRTFVAVHPNNYFTPFRESGNTLVPNQNLKGTIFQNTNGTFEDIDYLMITENTLRSQAERLAAHNSDFRELNVKTVTLDQIYEEFGGGRPDIGAIRNFVRYVYENASSDANRLRYVCLFGDASVDYKNRLFDNNNIMPTYQTYESFSLANSFMSDDYFGAMDPDEGWVESSNSSRPQVPTGGQNDKLDIAVGRIVVDTQELATTVVDKIINYDARASFGRWRNNFVLVSDDVDEAFEFDDLQGTLDDLGDEISVQKPFVNVIKIHSDAFQQQSSAGGDRYPQVNEAIENAIEVGSLVVTYLGHGGEELLSAEAIVTQNEISNLDNGERLPLIVTVTCEFGKFDNPERPTGGEELFWAAEGGAVGLVTTTREIFVSLGVDFNEILAGELFSFGTNEIQSVAENVRVSKNNIPGNDALRRVIFFVGDPAMKLAFPRPDIQLSAINDVPVGQELPVLKALDLVKVNGRVTRAGGQTLTNYNGTLAVTLYDKKINRQTLGNDGVQIGGELAILDFTTLGAILYRGQASVTNGNFEFTFRMPRDTAIPLGNGRMNFYSERLGILEDQAGVDETIIIGGLNENAPEDNIGPSIRLFMNDENFVNGGITNDSPIILAKLEDENGINTAGGIGHDILAIIDGDETNPIIMNDFYETDIDNFMRGTAARRIRNLEPGPHTLTFRAWDVYNNSSTAELQFVVLGDEELELQNVLNYPNPFVNYTEFWFNHNRPFEPLDVQVQIFTVSGKVVKTINQSVVTEGFLSRDITWDGLDDFGQAIGKGVYVYKITVRSTLTNKQVEKFEKLVIL